MTGLSSRDMEVLEFARIRFKYRSSKSDAIWARWRWSLTRYGQVLNTVIGLPEAEVYDPAHVRRLRRLQAARRRTHGTGKAGWSE